MALNRERRTEAKVRGIWKTRKGTYRLDAVVAVAPIKKGKGAGVALGSYSQSGNNNASALTSLKMQSLG